MEEAVSLHILLQVITFPQAFLFSLCAWRPDAQQFTLLRLYCREWTFPLCTFHYRLPTRPVLSSALHEMFVPVNGPQCWMHFTVMWQNSRYFCSKAVFSSLATRNPLTQSMQSCPIVAGNMTICPVVQRNTIPHKSADESLRTQWTHYENQDASSEFFWMNDNK